MREAEMDIIGELIARALKTPEDDGGAGDDQDGSRAAVPEVPAVSGLAGLTGRRVRLATVALARDPAGLRAACRPGRQWPRRSPRVFEDGGVLLAEAGTGTGKTLAYLVPAILSRQRVLVSTGTKNLQEQIFFKDIPALRAGARRPVHGDVHEGARELSVPAPARSAERRRPARRHARRLSADHSRLGRAAPKPATARSSRTCPRTCRSGTRCRRPPKPASAPSARATTTASSRACASAPPRPTS